MRGGQDIRPFGLAGRRYSSRSTPLPVQSRAIPFEGRQIAAMNLVMTLHAIRVEGRLVARKPLNHHMVGTIMPRMAPQAEERRRLFQQLLGHSAVRIVADRAALRHRRMLPHEWPLLRGVTFEAGQVDGGLPQEFVTPEEVATLGPVDIMAFGAKHFPFRNRVVERQVEQGSDLDVTPVAHQRLIDRHRHPPRTIDLIVVDIHDRWHPAERMRVMAIGAGHVEQGVSGRFPCHSGVALVAAQALIHTGFLANIIVRIVAGDALESFGAIDLMGMCDLFELYLLGVAFVAGPCILGPKRR